MTNDVAHLQDVAPSADVIAVNPPYGIAIGATDDVNKLYEQLFERASRILSAGGRIAIITPYPRIVEKLASKWMLEVKSIWNIHEGELQRTIHVIQKP
jgi:tRNA G10  N-methylase Trm11